MDEDRYRAMRAYIDLAVELGVEKKLIALRSALPTETRAAEPVVGPPGKDGLAGKDGIDGKPGAAGKDGANGIATREEIVAIVEERAAEISVRTFADTYKGVYKPDELYTRGVLTTWGGSLFLAKADTKDKPGESASWQLVVKRGADGKDVGNRR